MSIITTRCESNFIILLACMSIVFIKINELDGDLISIFKDILTNISENNIFLK